MKRAYSVIIVGAGPAGCSAASFLALKGHQVLLVDKAKFPRDKVCGDGISPLALEALDRLGVIQEIINRNPWRVDGVKLSSPSGQIVTANFSHLRGPYKHGWVMPRKEFDFILFEHVQRLANIQVLENAEVKDLYYEGDSIKGIKVQRGNSAEEFAGDIIIGADGVHSLIARRIFPANGISKNFSLGIRAYFHNVEGLKHYIEIHCEKAILPAYGWLFPIGENAANVGVGISAQCHPRRQLKQLFNVFINKNGFLREKLREAQLAENTLQGWPIPLGTFFPKRNHKNVLLIGDAGNFADILTGEGIYFALKSGECAAEAIHRGFNMGGGFARIGEIYERLWRKAFNSKEYLFRSLLQRLVTKESFINFNIRRATKKPNMAQTLASILCHQKSKIRLLL